MKTKCNFCDKVLEYRYAFKIPVCSEHWDMMSEIRVPEYICSSQVLKYKILVLESKLWKA